MAMLIAGIAIWSAAHLLPALATEPRRQLIARIGEPRYKLIFTLFIFLSLGLIIAGWKSAPHSVVYPVVASMRLPTVVLMLIAILLFAISATRNNFKRRLRHPQMTAVIVWSLAHLLSNGDAASLVLFGGFAVWAVVEIVAINRRDGTWQKPGEQPLKNDFVTIAAGLLGFIAALLLHPWIAGTSLIRISAGTG